MDVREAANLARNLLAQHGLHDWRFKFDSAKSRFGQCKHRAQSISMSRALTAVNSADEVKDTILHEIAHALVGPGHGHSMVWKIKAASIGARPEPCYGSEVVRAPTAFVGTCADCGKKIHRHRQPRASLVHTPCRRRANHGRMAWSRNSVDFNAPVAQAPTVVAVSQVAALAQEDINAMWERVQKIKF